MFADKLTLLFNECSNDITAVGALDILTIGMFQQMPMIVEVIARFKFAAFTKQIGL